jgi:hypothetical protein
MEQSHDSESGKRATPPTVARLVFEVSDGLQRVNNALLELSEYKAFAHQKDCLHEDAAQLRELRGDTLDYILETWRDVETSEADELRINRKVREKLARETDAASIAKHHHSGE